MMRIWVCVFFVIFRCIGSAMAAGPDCGRIFTMALHEHGLLYSENSDIGIDKDFAEELIRRSGCKVNVNVMTRSRIWQLIESGSLDFSLSGITNPQREHYAAFAWYFSNKYALLVRKDAGVRDLPGFLQNERLQLGLIRSFRYSPSANTFVATLTAANRTSMASGPAPLYEALIRNHIQAIITEPFDYPTLQQKEIRDLTTIIEFNDTAVPHGLIMSKKALPPAEQEKWRALVKEMRADGTVRRIFEKYFSAADATAMVDFMAVP
ncbi:MAG: transporter substrate-binding domain-containing protein [Herminiimonas sp.]|nr:transporter substrate-binding domain-containing protein [Herminiimonas sp.]